MKSSHTASCCFLKSNWLVGSFWCISMTSFQVLSCMWEKKREQNVSTLMGWPVVLSWTCSAAETSKLPNHDFPLQAPGTPLDEGEKVKVLVAQSCLTFWDPMDCNLPGSYDHGILQLEWADIPFFRGSFQLRDWSSWPRHWTQVSCIAGRFTVCVTRKPIPQGRVTQTTVLSVWLWDINSSHAWDGHVIYSLKRIPNPELENLIQVPLVTLAEINYWRIMKWEFKETIRNCLIKTSLFFKWGNKGLVRRVVTTINLCIGLLGLQSTLMSITLR